MKTIFLRKKQNTGRFKLCVAGCIETVSPMHPNTDPSLVNSLLDSPQYAKSFVKYRIYFQKDLIMSPELTKLFVFSVL